MTDAQLTTEERSVLDLLGDAWNQYVKLPVQHPMHQQEFAHAIHAAQQQIMSRPTARAEGWVKSPLQEFHPDPVPDLIGFEETAAFKYGDWEKIRKLYPQTAQTEGYISHLSQVIHSHEPGDHEIAQMEADGLRASRSEYGWAVTFPETEIGIGINQTSRVEGLTTKDAWKAAFPIWFVGYEVPREVNAILADKGFT